MIQVENLSYHYPNSKEPTLIGLDFSVRQGEIFGFLGPSGSGKSTTQKILYKVLKGFKGKAVVKNKPLQEWDSTYFQLIGVGFELPNHYLKLTGKENLQLFSSFYPKEKIKDIDTLFKMVGLEDSMDKKVSDYSKGMKMRLNFIRALMHDPEILFFDEPTAGLDPVNAKKIKQHIKDLKQAGKTVFITTHNMNTADELCDRVAFIAEGQLILTDVPSKLKYQYGKDLVKVETKQKGNRDFPLEQIGQNEDFLKFIKENELVRMYTDEATLEEVFVKVTGKTLKL